MQRVIIIAVLLGLSWAAQDASSPLPRVVRLLSDLKEQIGKDGEKETKEVEEYKDWCFKSINDLKYELGAAAGDIEDIQAGISKSDSDISVASASIEAEAGSMSGTDGEIKAADDVRKKESMAFKAGESELSETIDTLERAINVLERKMRGTALVEMKINSKDIKELLTTLNQVVNAAALSLHDKNKLTALVQDSEDMEDDMDGLGAPAATAYKAHGGSILDMLEDMKQKAESHLTELRKEESNAQHNYEMLRLSLVDQNKVASDEMAQAKDAKSTATGAKAGAEGDVAVSKKALNVDKESLANMQTGCMRVEDEYAAAQKGRAEELSAIDGALDALKDVSATSFMQLQSNHDSFEVVNMLRKLAQQQHSTALTQLAGRISTAMTMSVRRHDADPFEKVRKMVSQMVERLEKEGSEEQSHKSYCDKETKNNDAKKSELSYSLDKYNARVDKVTAAVAGRKDQAAKVQAELVKLAARQGEADEMRREEKASYEASSTDLEHGLAGVSTAIKVLRKYYDQATKAALLQQTQVGHGAHSGTGESVISILELVESDMGKELSAMKAQEADAAGAYVQLTKDTKLARFTNEQTLKYKTKEATSLAKTLNEYGSDMDATQTEMDAVLEEATNLKGMCDDSNKETFEQRQASREAELAGLREALQSLGASPAFLQKNLRGIKAVMH